MPIGTYVVPDIKTIHYACVAAGGRQCMADVKLKNPL